MIVHKDRMTLPDGKTGETEWLEPETVRERWLVLKQNARFNWDMTAKKLADLFEECVPWAAPAWNDAVHGPRWREIHGENWRDVCDDIRPEVGKAHWRSVSEKFKSERLLSFSEGRTLRTHVSGKAGEEKE